LFKTKYLLLFLVLSLSLIFFVCGRDSLVREKAVSSPNQYEYSLDEIAFIKSQVESVGEEDIKSILMDLEQFGTRYSPSRGNLKAAQYIKGKFYYNGFHDAYLDKFSYFSEISDLYEETQNVVASKKGLKTPGKIVIIGGHFDTITRRAEDGRTSKLNKENPAPGTDDNGTGVAAVLTAARILSPYDFDCTLRFVAFSAEEQGLFGSTHYAAQCARKNENIIAMINMDMIGYQDQEPEDIDIFANQDSAWLLDRLVNNIPLYAPGLLAYRIVDDSYDGSDHGPFWNNGYSAVVCSQDESRIYQVDLVEKKITAIIADNFLSMRLILSPDKKKIVAVHHMNSSISVFKIEQRANVQEPTKIKSLDLQERIEDAVFGQDSDHLYLISSSRCRLFGLDLLTDQVFWAMRTGGVRPRAGFTQILYLHR